MPARKVDDSSFLDEDYSKSSNKDSGSKSNKNQQIEKLSEEKRRSLFISLLQIGLDPAEAIVGAQLDPLHDSMAEVNLEELLLSRIRNPNAKVYTKQQLDLLPSDFNSIRKEGELTLDELRGLVDWMYYVKSFPLMQVAKVLAVPVSIIADIKKDISDEKYLAIKRLTPENYIGDFIHQQEKLKAIAFHDLAYSQPGSKEKIMLLKFLQSADETVIEKLQDIGIIEKHLGNLQVHEEWTIKVSQTGPPTTQHREYKDDDAFKRTELEEIIDAEILNKTNLKDIRSLPELAFLDRIPENFGSPESTKSPDNNYRGERETTSANVTGALSGEKRASNTLESTTDKPYTSQQGISQVAPTPKKPALNLPHLSKQNPVTPKKLTIDEIRERVKTLLDREATNPALTQVYIDIPKPNPDQIPDKEFVSNPADEISKFIVNPEAKIKIKRG